jgi:HEAT repeat protein
MSDMHDHDDLYDELQEIGELDEIEIDDGTTEVRRPERPVISATLEALRDSDETISNTTVYYGLSGLTPDELKQLAPVWESLTAAYRRKIVRQMIEVGETNVDLNYAAMGKFALKDTDPSVREAAVELLFEDMSITLLNQLIEMAQFDESREVRAVAASALGRFILAGELENLPEREAVRAQDAAINILNNDGEDVAVRRRALEAIANSSHEIIEDAIKEAYENHDRQMRVSAVFAMGRSCDEQWTPMLLRELDSDDPEMRYEAARAAGEIMAEETIPLLTRLTSEADREIKEAAIWSLGEIGGLDAKRVLTRLAQTAEDEALLEAIEDALATAQLENIDLFDS